MPSPVLTDVLFEHLEEMACLWIQRRKLVLSPDVPMRALRRLHERIAAHRDGLAVGDAAATAIAEQQVASDDPWLAAAAMLVWLEQEQPQPEAVIERLEASDPVSHGAWREAFRRLDTATFDRLIATSDVVRMPEHSQGVVVDALGWRGRLSAEARGAFARSKHSGVRAAVARFATDSQITRTLLDDSDVAVRRRAVWGGAIGQSAVALAFAREHLRRELADPSMFRVLGFFGDFEDGQELARRIGPGPLGHSAMAALLDLGIPHLAGDLLDMLDHKDEETATLARDAFESLVGRPVIPEEPNSAGTFRAAAAAHWDDVRDRLAASTRILRGRDYLGDGPTDDLPMEVLWRTAIARPSQELMWLIREVPDGLFDGPPTAEAIPGT